MTWKSFVCDGSGQRRISHAPESAAAQSLRSRSSCPDDVLDLGLGLDCRQLALQRLRLRRQLPPPERCSWNWISVADDRVA
jgi:hypothetical protein